MLVANSFDLWQKDSFFSAAEEVQESSDTMESVFRRWDRERIEGLAAEDLDELSRELQTALGTAKWQLEEFERAVRLSYRNCSDDITTARHRQFAAAIEDQISRVEAGLREYFNKDGEQPLQWVKLDEEECNDLAAFLSGTPRTSRIIYDGVKLGTCATSSIQEPQFDDKSANKSLLLNQTKGFNDILASDEEFEYVIEHGTKEIPQTRDDMYSSAETSAGTRRMRNSPDTGSWKIVIADKDEQVKVLQSSKKTCGDHRLGKGGIICCTQSRGIKIDQILGRFGVGQRRRFLYLRITSVRFALALMLTIFLFVPFVLYSS